MPAPAKKSRTVLSTKGQVILPKAVRDDCGWAPGLQLTVEKTPDGVLLKPAATEPLFPPTRMEEVFGILKYDGPPATFVEMKAAVAQEAVARYERSLKLNR